MRKKRIQLTEQIRQAVDDSDLSRYRIAILSGIDHGTLSKFMAGKIGMRLPTLDRLTDVLELNIETQPGERKKR